MRPRSLVGLAQGWGQEVLYRNPHGTGSGVYLALGAFQEQGPPQDTQSEAIMQSRALPRRTEVEQRVACTFW
jgi:hypothetical protein